MKHLISFLKSLAAFAVGVIISLIAYYHFSIPPFPCFGIYATSFLFTKNNSENVGLFLVGVRVLFIGLTSLFVLICYSVQVYMEIAYYPHYGNALAVIISSTTFLLSLGSCVFCCCAWTNEWKTSRKERRDSTFGKVFSPSPQINKENQNV